MKFNTRLLHGAFPPGMTFLNILKAGDGTDPCQRLAGRY